MKEIDIAVLSVAFQEWRMAVNGSKSYIVRKHASALGISYGTLHRKFKAMGFQLLQKRPKVTKGQSKIPGLHDMAKQIARLYAFIPARAGRRPSLEIAIRKAIENSMLPESAKDISVSTFARVLREKGFLDTEGRVLRFEAARPMEQVQYDVSGSEYLYVVGIDNGEPVLRVRASKAYKNKDRFENLRVWYHGMVDDHSRYWLAMPFVAPGESSVDAVKFCKWAFARKQDERIVFRGLPGRVYMDNGPLAKAEATRNFFERQLGVEIKTHEPESPSDTGKIEIRWRHLWSGFEAAEFLMDPHWEKREYRLSELKDRLMNYTVEVNNKKHPNLMCTRTQAWMAVMQHGGVIDIDESAFGRAFTRLKRLVGKDGIMRLENERYFVKGLLDAWVWVYRGLLEESIVVEDMMTHQRYEATPFEMPALDGIRADKKLEGVKIREEAQALKKQMKPGEFRGIYERREETKVVPLPAQTKETREVFDVFDIDTHPSLQEAMREFCEIVGVYIEPSQREAIEGLIQENGLRKQYVTDLALELHKASCKKATAAG